ncbi:caspase family protein [Flammeovirga kamogawensis]|uniref:Caspase family protein n=1 Tax=Flammeovirga kamogawensis TaxID=373891 RepID=A0ABX8GY71_9BACT|nr:caspase family protein [Flammeovirga kamogawensis]MBB6460940.1 WD40 repeat protein [Flammeovirga kamogawensis]QWG08282.1 caspase family protein [Flammeovirga kamogawensis]TRX70084.1 PDZ domain-containing protein [Flammeovirga kamogawensis]
MTIVSKRFLLITLFYLLYGKIYAQEDIHLRLSNEMHLEEMTDICTSSKFYVTTSQDKTVKVWDSTNGTLIKTLRVPIGNLLVGKLFACAFSEDEKELIVSGFTGQNKQSKNIYIFDTQEWEIKQVIKGIPNVVSDLNINSKNGDLIVSMYGINEVLIYQKNGRAYSLLKKIDDFGDETRDIDFGPQHRLFITCLDGFIYQYDEQYKLYNKIQAQYESPRGLSFTSDKEYFTVFYLNSEKISHYKIDATFNIKLENEIIIKNVYRINAIKHNQKNELLVAINDTVSKERPNLVVISNDGLGKQNTQKIGHAAITMIEEYHDNYIFLTSLPEIVFVDHKLKEKYIKKSKGLNFYQNEITDFKINKEANVLSFFNGSTKMFFDISTRSFVPSAKDVIYTSSDTRGDIKIENWKYSMQPVINGDTVTFLKEYEFCQAVDITLDGKFIAMGTHRGLYYLTKDKKIVWHIDVPSPIINVIITKNQDKLVTFSQDGSVRWYSTKFEKREGVTLSKVNIDGLAYKAGIRPDDVILTVNGSKINSKEELRPLIRRKGSYTFKVSRNGAIKTVIIDKNKPKFGIFYAPPKMNEYLLSLFISPEDSKWIFYTSKGYYDTAIGAEKYLGWHVNVSDDKVYFYDVSRLRNLYYAPDTINKYIETSTHTFTSRSIDTKEVLENLPPVVKIKYPRADEPVSTNTIALEYTAQSINGAEIEEVKVLIDGGTFEQTRGLKVKKGEVNLLEVTLPKNDCLLQVIAKNKNGWSEPSSVKVKWNGDVENEPKPNLYLLAIGVSNYKLDHLDLKYGSKDASDFKQLIDTQKSGLFQDIKVKLLTDNEATKGNILDALEWIQNETTQKDVAMIFVAGHGMNDRNGAFYYLPHDADLNSIRRTCLFFGEFQYTISTIPGKVVMFIDTCHSGNVLNGTRSVNTNITKAINELSDVENGAIVFTSSTGNQLSVESDQWKNGAFTKALLDGLGGEADLNNQGVIYIKSLDWYLSRRVKELTSGRQSPTTIIPYGVPNFPIFIDN